MSYPRGLDEYSTAELLDEIDERIIKELEGRCPYCNGDPASHQCRFRSNLAAYHELVTVTQWIHETQVALEPHQGLDTTP